jgi:hypothetical protein
LKRLYIPKVLSDIIWATTQNSTSVRFGFGHLCHKHKRMFTLDHLKECELIKDCPDISKYAERIRKGENIRTWEEKDILDAVAQFSSLAM